MKEKGGNNLTPTSKALNQPNRRSSQWADVFLVALASLILHGLVFLFVAFIPQEAPPYLQKDVVTTTTFEEKMDDTPPPELDLNVLELEELLEVDVEIEAPDVSEVEVTEEALMDIELELEDVDDSDLDELMDLNDLDNQDQSLDVLSLASLSALGSQSELPSAYEGRSSQKSRQRAMKKFGGSVEAVTAVEKALAWLAKTQLADGSWPHLAPPKIKVDPKKAEKGNPEKKVGAKKGEPVKAVQDGEGKNPLKKDPQKTIKRRDQEAITASALLAFLGAGYTEMNGKYKTTVRKGVQYINSSLQKKIEERLKKTSKKEQRGKGVKQRPPRPYFQNNYGESIILMVLCETSIFGSSPTTKRHANILADGLLKGYDGQGWGYNGAGDDFSVSGWVALGLKSAIQAQLPIMQDEAKIDKLFKVYGDWVNKMTDPETGDGFYRPDKKGSTALSWVGMFQKQFLGFPRHDPFLKKAAAVGMKNAAKTMGRDKNKKLMWKDEYGLYYGTLAAFQQQGKFWKMWNPLMLEVLLGTQEQEKTSDNYGSWTPSHKHIGERGGRVMSTALLTLCLEVYYRYALMQ